MQNNSLQHSEKSFSEALTKVANQTQGNDKIILQAWSKLIQEDHDYFEGLIDKLNKRTGLNKQEIRESLKRFRTNPLHDKLKIQIITESINPLQ